MDENLPVIQLELNAGVFRIKTGEAVYQITVKPESSLTRVVEKVVEKEAAQETGPAQPAQDGDFREDRFYREISEEMYAEIGGLARQMSLSLKDIPGETFRAVDLEKTGVELADAKDQLENIVQMTEKATMDIMDLTEAMARDCQEIKTHLDNIQGLDFLSDQSAALDWEEAPPQTPSPNETGSSFEFLNGLLAQTKKLKELVEGLPRSGEKTKEVPGGTPAEMPKVTSYRFDLDVVFQTLYELCTNETVKSHIKAMRTEQEAAFEAETIQKALSDLAPTVEREEDFFNFQIPAVLKVLFQGARSDKHKQVIKKMNQTAANIFLDSILPLEGRMEEKVIAEQKAAEPEAAPAQSGLSPEKIEELLVLIDENVKVLEKEIESTAQPAEGPSLSGPNPPAEYTYVKNDDRETIINEIEQSGELIGQMTAQVTRIMEALSFQDLSGQRIMKIVGLISQIQVQLLSLLVSFRAKIKSKETEKEIRSVKETESLAQEEVDKMLERVSAPAALAGPDGASRLDQDAVDNLLAEMGF